ncbi:MAG: hypothetical protein NZ900_00755 [Synergistetes bacterium]|nr:hypothetical protein [Synergistota bacterium]MDW8191457.1 hypothetical protein [Synergistota bacterium]
MSYRIERLRLEIESFESLPSISPQVLKVLEFLKGRLSLKPNEKDLLFLERLFRYLLRSSRMDIPWALKAYLEEESGIKPIVSTYDGWFPTYYPMKDFFLLLLPEFFLEEPLLYPYLYGLYLRWIGLDIPSSDKMAIKRYGEAYKFALGEVLFPKGESRLKFYKDIDNPVMENISFAINQLKDSLPPIDCSLPELFNAGWILIKEGTDRRNISELLMTALKLRAFRKEWYKFKHGSDTFSGDIEGDRKW